MGSVCGDTVGRDAGSGLCGRSESWTVGRATRREAQDAELDWTVILSGVDASRSEAFAEPKDPF
jgi:hypothetical protein